MTSAPPWVGTGTHRFGISGARLSRPSRGRAMGHAIKAGEGKAQCPIRRLHGTPSPRAPSRVLWGRGAHGIERERQAPRTATGDPSHTLGIARSRVAIRLTLGPGSDGNLQMLRQFRRGRLPKDTICVAMIEGMRWLKSRRSPISMLTRLSTPKQIPYSACTTCDRPPLESPSGGGFWMPLTRSSGRWHATLPIGLKICGGPFLTLHRARSPTAPVRGAFDRGESRISSQGDCGKLGRFFESLTIF
jgi:hypothetical protein